VIENQNNEPLTNRKKVNLIKRTITGVLFVALLVSCILAGYISFGVLFSLIVLLSTHELTGLINDNKGTSVNRPFIMAAALLTFLTIFMNQSGCYTSATPAVTILLVLSLMVIFIMELYRKKESPILNLAASALAIIYVAVPFSLLSVLAYFPEATNTQGYSFILPLAIFIFIWCNDVGAYCFGCTLGKHRLFERVSPKKSWEGFFGGCFTSALAGFIISRIPAMAGNMSTLIWIGMALVVSIFGTWGDLVESLIKREMGVKDSGNILPGHGGMLDRFDSTLMAVPATVVYLMLVFNLF